MPELTIPERVRFVYQEVWHEFFDWEQEYCRQMLTSLDPCGGTLQPPLLIPEVSGFEEIATEEASSTATDCIQLWRFDLDAEVTTEVLSCPTYSCTSLEPVKSYEACTYSHKNLYAIGDDVCEKLPFMPFSDDPHFPAAELFELYESMGWETRKDPDLEVIVAEAARRLHFRFGISFVDIDQTGILPISIIERPERKGLLQILNQRDMLSWPGSILSDLPALPTTDCPPPTSLRKRVNGIRYLFCANLNCVEPYCPTHLNLDQQLKNPPNSKDDADAKSAGCAPCGYHCHKYLSDKLEGLTFWDEATIDDFKFILEGAADLSTCDLAIICDKPCSEIYAHRQRYIVQSPGDPGSPEAVSDYECDSVKEKPIFADIVRGSKASDSLPPSEICQHMGKCDVSADCRCYRKKLHCHRNCRCDLTCQRRPKGCLCKNSGRKLCRTTKCPCFRAGRECDPELCRKCGAKDSTLSKCRNNDIQHGKFKGLEVKEGAFGFGLFLLEPARAGDLIGEYVGEILNDKMTDARGVHARHLGRNYLFGLNAEWTIDAALVGNETRFINHAQGSQANCRAEVREVNGDHRIGIYAVKNIIQPGEELFMDYGDEYFTGGVKGGTPRAEGKR